MGCEYQGCENQAEKTIWTNDEGPESPVCVVCTFHADMIQNAPVQSLAIEAHVHRTVWLTQGSFPGDHGVVH